MLISVCIFRLLTVNQMSQNTDVQNRLHMVTLLAHHNGELFLRHLMSRQIILVLLSHCRSTIYNGPSLKQHISAKSHGINSVVRHYQSRRRRWRESCFLTSFLNVLAVRISNTKLFQMVKTEDVGPE